MLLAVAAAALLGCENSDPTVERSGRGIDARLFLRDSSGQTRSKFLRGEPITFVLRLENRSAERITVFTPTPARFDFAVENGQGVLWSYDRVVIQVLGSFVLEPRTPIEFTAVWNQMDNALHPVPPGMYTASGLVPPRSAPQVSEERYLEIR